MLTITKLENDGLEFSDDGDKLFGDFNSDGSGHLAGNDKRRFERLQKKYGKRQLSATIQAAVRNGSDTLEAL